MSMTIKYDDDVEYFVKELRNIYERHTHNLDIDQKLYQTLWDTTNS